MVDVWRAGDLRRRLCGVPRLLPLPPLMAPVFRPHRALSTGAFQHSFDQPQHMPGRKTRRATDFRRSYVRIVSKYFERYRIDHVGVAPADQPVHSLTASTALRFGSHSHRHFFQVLRRDRFQHQLGGPLYYPIRIVGTAERSSPPPGFGDHHPRCTAWGRYRSKDQLLAQAQPATLPHACLTIWQSSLRATPAAPRIRCGTNAWRDEEMSSRPNLVVEQIEAEAGLGLRLLYAYSPKVLILSVLQGYRQSPHLSFFKSVARSQGPSLPQHYPAHGTTNPVRLPSDPPHCATLEFLLSNRDGSPPIPHHHSKRAMTLPRRTDGCASSICFPSSRPFPTRLAGRRPHNFTFEAAQTSLALRPRWMLKPQARIWSRGLVEPRLDLRRTRPPRIASYRQSQCDNCLLMETVFLTL